MTYADLLTTALQAHEQGARRSGRTDRMLQTLPENATVVCLSEREADLMKRRLMHDYRRDDVTFIVCGVDMDKLVDRLTRQGRARRGAVVLDHNWAQQFWLGQVRQVDTGLTALLEHFSSSPEPTPREWKYLQ